MRARDVTGWLLRRRDVLAPCDQQNSPGRAPSARGWTSSPGHVTSFAKMLTGRTGAQDLKTWLQRVEADDQPELHSLAAGIRRDQETVAAGLPRQAARPRGRAQTRCGCPSAFLHTITTSGSRALLCPGLYCR